MNFPFPKFFVLDAQNNPPEIFCIYCNQPMKTSGSYHINYVCSCKSKLPEIYGEVEINYIKSAKENYTYKLSYIYIDFNKLRLELSCDLHNNCMMASIGETSMGEESDPDFKFWHKTLIECLENYPWNIYDYDELVDQIKLVCSFS